MASPTETTAFVVALVALVIALLQVVQQYMASSILRSKVGRAAIGTWAKKNRLRLNLSEFKIRQEYLQPALTWDRVIKCLTIEDLKRRTFRRALEDKFHLGVSSGVAINAQGAYYARPPRLRITRTGDEEAQKVPHSSLSWAERRVVTKYNRYLADRYNARRVISIASWSNMMAVLVGNPALLSAFESWTDTDDSPFEDDSPSKDEIPSKFPSYCDADTIPSALDNPPMEIHFTDLISCAVALNMEMRSYDLHKPALHMTSQHCSIASQEHSGAGVIARFTYSPDHVHEMHTCTTFEVKSLVSIAKGYMRVGDSSAHMFDWGYNSVDTLFSIAIDRVNGDDWQEIPLKDKFYKHCEGDADIQWGGHWSRPNTPRVGFLLTHCGNPAVANSFPHSLLNEWPSSDRIPVSLIAYNLVNQGVGFIEPPQDFPRLLFSTGVVMNEYKLANNWGAECGGIRGWSMGSGAEFVRRASPCWQVASQTQQVPILAELRPLLQQGHLSQAWGRAFTSKFKRFSPEHKGEKPEAGTLCWIQCMMLDTWIARQVDLLMLGTTDEAAIPVDVATANKFAKMAVDGGASSKGLTTGFKKCRALFIRHYLARLADGIMTDSGDRIGVSCMSPGGGMGAAGWEGMPVGDPNDWAALDAVLSLRAVVMATRLELLYNTDVFLELLQFDPMIRMA
ncbi:hypothetical protein MVEN_01580100 [Mycena venus]|uniref:Uncharacterized protein n=1 Tax=Mycena venus TaxID=2733690 RepID=A0A8H7CRL3_9AGAR|nr:hypothetical protein MVEN_01580100 [Mycena venus]